MKIETTLEEMPQEYGDWEEAISVSHRDDRGVLGSGSVSTEPFKLDDVAEVLASSEGMNDDQSWIALFLLKDGRYAYIDAWCDYTGWG